MEQFIEADATAFAKVIHSTGHAAVYGILFDAGKTDIQPESAKAIEEIAKLLKTDEGLTLYVVGHTDNQGDFDDNVTLSQSRAAAVAAVLTGRHGIKAIRLTPFQMG